MAFTFGLWPDMQKFFLSDKIELKAFGKRRGKMEGGEQRGKRIETYK